MRFVFSVIDDDGRPIVEQTEIGLEFTEAAFVAQTARDAAVIASLVQYSHIQENARRLYGRGRVVTDIINAACIVASKQAIAALLDHFKVPYVGRSH